MWVENLSEYFHSGIFKGFNKENDGKIPAQKKNIFMAWMKKRLANVVQLPAENDKNEREKSFWNVC